MVMQAEQQTRSCWALGWQSSFETKLPRNAGRHEQFFKNTDRRNCWYMDYMQELSTAAAYHVNAGVA